MENVNNNEIKKRKQKPSLLDPFRDEIKYYYDLGVTIPNITRIMNEKTPVKMSSTAYRHFIKTKLAG